MARPASAIAGLVLGSGSPRRSDLLAALGLDFTIATVAIDEEKFVVAGDAHKSARSIAARKFAAFTDQTDAKMLLTADTLVQCNREVMGKPGSLAELSQMLRFMSGRSISVVTTFCLGVPGADPTTETVTTIIRLRDLTAHEVERYVDTGVGMDKAGGLALQSEAGSFIAAVDGCWSNVLGLPICAVARALDLEPGGDREARCSAELCGTRQT